VLLFGAGWLMTDPLDISTRDFAVVACFGLSFATASTLWNEGARRLPASEAGLLGGAEVPLAILLAWLILSELPPREGMIGGAVVLAAVFTYAGRDFVLRKRRDAVEVGAS
jgi:drug/metabolite transporter (DMT)-like permease